MNLLWYTVLIVSFHVECFLAAMVSYARNHQSAASSASLVNTKPSCFNNLLMDLSNQSFTASSIWRNQPEFLPYKAKMLSMVETVTKTSGQAWCPHDLITSSRAEWLEIDFHSLKFIVNLFTVGRGDGNFEEFVPFFYLDYSRENEIWIQYKNLKNERLLTGNSDSRNVARTKFDSPILASKIRIYPICDHNPRRACLRIGIYGCSSLDGVVEYSVVQGHIYPGTKVYDFRDKTYDVGDPLSSKLFTTNQILRGGIGQLMDNVIYNGPITAISEESFHFIGWNRHVLKKNTVEIAFKFNEVRSIKQVKLFSVSNPNKQIDIFSRVTVHFSIGGVRYDVFNRPQTYTPTRIDYSKMTSLTQPNEWIDFVLKTTLARFIIIEMEFFADWIILSEIIIHSDPTNLLIDPEPIINTNEDSQNKKTSAKNLLKSSSGTSTKYPATNTIYTKDNKDRSMDKVMKINSNNMESSNNSDQLWFKNNKSFSIFAISASCVIAIVLILGFVFAMVMIWRKNSRISTHKKKKIFVADAKVAARNRNFNQNGNGTVSAGALLLDSNFIAPLSTGTHSSSGAGSIYYKHTGYLPTKDYTTTLSSKSCTDYDIAGGNSLDGLIPNVMGNKLAINWVNPEFPCLSNPYSRNSFDGSIDDSSNTDYASASLYHGMGAIMPDTSSSISSYPFHANFNNNNFPLKPLNSPAHYNPLPNTQAYRLSQLYCGSSYSPYKTQSQTSSTQMLLANNSNHSNPLTPVHNYISPQHNPPTKYIVPSRFTFNGLGDILHPMKCQQITNNFFNGVKQKFQPITGIFGSSTMLDINSQRSMKHEFLAEFQKALGRLIEIKRQDIGSISLISQNQFGFISFTKLHNSDQFSDNFHDAGSLKSCTFLSKSISSILREDSK